MQAQEVHLLLVVVKHPLHVTGYVVHVNGMSAIGQHVDRTVIARDNHKCTAFIGVKHIVVSKTRINLGFLGMDKLQLPRRGQ